jgi:MFS family permease
VEPAPAHRVGIFLGVVQFIFTLTWTVYVIFLPALAAQAGIPKHWVVFILLLDQVIFAVMDFAMGLAADRMANIVGRLGHIILAVTLLSCAAFLLLPYAAPQGSAVLLFVLIILWAITSSALRAPPLVLLGKYSPEPAVPWLSALSLFGLGLAGAISPYLTITLRDVDPRLPFVATSLALALATVGIIWAERALTGTAPAAAPKPRELPPQRAIGFMLAALLLGVGFQIHFSLNSATFYQRFAKPDQLQYLMPVFWIGFNVFMLPASIATKRYGGVAVASFGAIVAGLASLGATVAENLSALVVLQFIAGGGWGCVLMSAVAAAIAIGHTGHEGRFTGGLFSLLAVAAFIRIGVLAAGLNKDPEIAALLTWLPLAAWGGAGLILLFLLRTSRNMVAAVRV